MNVPYFMSNKEWYYRSQRTGKFVLTPKAPPEAIKSFNEYLAKEENRLLNSDDEIKNICMNIRNAYRKNIKQASD